MSDPFIGEIRMVAFNYAPDGWAFCDGSVLPPMQHQALFGLLGKQFGGNGQTTFCLPDLRGRSPVGASIAQSTITPAADYPFGTHGGATSYVLSAANVPVPPHTHAASVVASIKAATESTPTDSSVIAGATDTVNQTTFANFGPASSTSVMLSSNSVYVSPARGTTPPDPAIPTVPPYLAVNFIIALTGYFPPRW